MQGEPLVQRITPCVGLDLRACLRPVLHIKGPTPAAQGKAGVRSHAAASHGINDPDHLAWKNKRGCVRSIGLEPGRAIHPRTFYHRH